MTFYDPYQTVIAVAENSAGNEMVGDTWLETRAFGKEQPISDVIRWAKRVRCSGKLILTINENNSIVEDDKDV